ncbi:exodeoxyribonuclease III [Candidatus Saccharibacteria bacterium]|nr:exodeoxyribonuclease III [Candidatus Saccharibacteria bacterium]
MLRIFSWNVNGIRAVLRKGALQEFISEYSPDILCLQEIKAKPEQVDYDFPGYQALWNPAVRPGYSGTAILFSARALAMLFSSADLSTLDVIHWDAGKDCPSGNFLGSVRNIHLERTNLEFYASENSIARAEGRIQTIDCHEFYLVNVYTPNSKPDLARLSLREKEWDPGFLGLLKELEREKPVVACGDFNAAFSEIDLARPEANHHSAGFTDEERRGVGNLLEAGFVDTFRALNPGVQRYTWWSHWGQARANNVGWRIDYFFVSGALKDRVAKAEIYEGVIGSDHCPISIDLAVDASGRDIADEGAVDYSGNRGRM